MGIRSIVLVTATLFLSASSLAADDKSVAKEPKNCCSGPVLKIGAVAYSPSCVTIFRAMRHYFAKNEMPMEFVLYSTYDELCDALEKKHVDLAWNSPQAHAKYHLKAGDSQTLVMRDADVNYRVKLVVPKDSGITSIKDLHGKTITFGSCDSADSTVLPAYFLKKEGVDFERVKVLSLHEEVDALGCPCNSQQHVLEALLKGRGQAGAIGPELWSELQSKQPDRAAKLKEIWVSPPFSHCVFTARKDFCRETGARFTKLMTAMDGKDPLTAEILKLEYCTKWVPAGKEAQEGYTDLLDALRAPSSLPVSLSK